MSLDRLHTQHERHFEANRFVYPVLSRRSGGISLGINLNPDKVCNFDCVYCQVNRVSQAETRFVEIPQLLDELAHTLDLVTSGALFSLGKFRDTPGDLQHLTDVAFSGDGEPTTHRNFDEVVAACTAVKRSKHLDHVPVVLITNASMFHRDHVQRALKILDANHGEIWAKLDAGTEEYYNQINRAPFRFEGILQNITEAARAPHRDPVALHAHPPAAASAVRVGGLLRPAERNHRCGRSAEARSDLHDRPHAR